MAFKYEISHISTEDNCWADVLSRCPAPFNALSCSLPAWLVAPVNPDLNPDFCLFTDQDIKRCQGEWPSSNDRPLSVLDGLLTTYDTFSILARATKLLLGTCIDERCGRNGHRGADTTISRIRQNFYEGPMQSNMLAFCTTCLHSVRTSRWKRITRSLRNTLLAKKPND